MRHRDIIKKIQDYRDLAWDEKAVTSGTGGTFLKSRRKSSRGDVYYKLSNYDWHRGIYGHESVNELIASRLLDELAIPHIPYRLIHAYIEVNGKTHETWLSESRDYRKSNERRQALDTYIELNARGNESPLEFCEKMGWSESISAMMAFDYLIINRDRHGANIEITLSGNNSVELAPLFDHGVSLAYSCYGDEEKISVFDSKFDWPANNFLGTRSLNDNLSFVNKGILSHRDFDEIESNLFRGLEGVIPSSLKEKIWEILTLRWQRLLDLGIAEERDA